MVCNKIINSKKSLKIRIKNINNILSVHCDFDHSNPAYIDMKWGQIEGKMLKKEFQEKPQSPFRFRLLLQGSCHLLPIQFPECKLQK